jgi:hypothetical protein
MTRYDADLGDSDPGTALRVIMTASVSDVYTPADLLDRAVSRDRKRKARNRLTGAVGAAAVVAAAATVIAAAPGGPSGRPALKQQTVGPQAQTAAYVLNRAAAAQVSSYRMISVDQETNGGSVVTFYTDVATHQQRIVQPDLQIATGIVGGVTRETDVEYKHHVYSTFTPSDDPHGGANGDPFAFLPGQTNQDPAVAFHRALKAGIIAVVGHRSLNGRDTIMIRVSAAENLKAAGVNPAARVHDPGRWIWIDATTYLVVQTKNFPFYGHGLPPVVDHVTWLSPTSGNLALLTVTPPAGFTKIPYSEMAQILKPMS